MCLRGDVTVCVCVCVCAYNTQFVFMRYAIASYPVSTASFILHVGNFFSNMQNKAGSGDWVRG